MTDTDVHAAYQARWSQRLLTVLAISFIVVGLLNATPAIPGWDALWESITGIPHFTLRRFAPELFYPIALVWMMAIVALRHSARRAWTPKSTVRRRAGLALDIALVLAAVGIAVTYLIELEAVCLIDQITGDRARLIAEALKAETEFATTMGLPVPDQVEDPRCLNTTGAWLPLIVLLCVIVFLAYNAHVWGLPLVIVSILVAAYTFATVANWYFFGAEGQNKYLVTILSSVEPRSLADGRVHVWDALTNNSAGLLGRFMGVLMTLVFPYIVLGGLFGRCAGGRSLIKLAFLLTRNLRGGPAHAAIISSAMFGTITGGPVINVLSTGVLTIPMMLKRGFSRVFAGGLEAAASSGGSIMPPIMGVAAFVMAALTAVPYREIIVAAAIPAFFYFICLFLSVVFQARKQGIEPIGKATADMRLDRADRIHLIQIFAPLVLVLVLLLTPKDSVGCGWIAGLLGAVADTTNGGCRIESLPWAFKLLQNAAGDAGAAGWYATMLLIVLLFLDPEFRAQPKRLLDALADSGFTISTLFLMFLAVTVIDVCLNFTGLAKFVAVDVLRFLQSINADGSGFLFIALFMTMGLAILLGMGMPAVPAYINAALLMGPLLAGIGVSIFTAHMFVFYFAVASAITPPVAVAAFAAASITKAEPMATAFSAVKSGVVMFIIPFAFAFYPELLVIDKAVLDPNSSGGLSYLPGYDGQLHWPALGLIIARLILALYVVSSALAAFDRRALGTPEIALRLVLAALIMFKPEEIWIPAVVATGALIGVHNWRSRALDLKEDTPR